VSPEKNSLRVGAVNAFRKFNVYVSKQRWLKSIWPPSPFHRATGIMASNPACSAAIHHRYFRSAEALSREVSEACLLERAGARLIDMVVPSAEQAQTNIHICMARADMADIHRDEMELRPDAIGPEVLRRLRLGLDVSGCDYAAARRWLAQWRRDLREMFKEVDLLLTPTTRIVAPLRKASADMVETTQRWRAFTVSIGCVGLPALTLPCGLGEAGMPIGAQLVAKWLDEALLFRAAADPRGPLSEFSVGAGARRATRSH
jgi:Asp-tRNA(Asn)/Glu-tRNA(Gln) amidotransferase A subunit family amidase